MKSITVLGHEACRTNSPSFPQASSTSATSRLFREGGRKPRILPTRLRSPNERHGLVLFRKGAGGRTTGKGAGGARDAGREGVRGGICQEQGFRGGRTGEGQTEGRRRETDCRKVLVRMRRIGNLWKIRPFSRRSRAIQGASERDKCTSTCRGRRRPRGLLTGARERGSVRCEPGGISGQTRTTSCGSRFARRRSCANRDGPL